MSLPDFSLRRPVFATVMSILIVFFGVVGYTFLGVREYPAIDPPNITVRTNYTGANAEVIESQVTEPLERAINGIAGIRTISSSSALGNSNITVEFDLGIDLEQAANDVRDKVSQAQRNLPQDIDAPPVVTKADASGDPILFVPIQSSTRSIMELSDYAENVIREKIQTIPGVSAVNVFGSKLPAMRLWMDPSKMNAYGLTAQDVLSALSRENVELPGGKLRGDATELTVKTFGRLSTEEEFNNMIIRSSPTAGGGVVRFKDIGEAVLGPDNEETGARRNLVQGVSLAVIPQPGSNWVEITNEFYRRYDQIQKDLPPDIVMSVGIDKTRFVRRAISEVTETLFIAIGLVVLIIYLFFRNWIIALRPLIDIPVSLIGAFFLMWLFGFSINVLTLLAIVLATGLVVDDGIVVTENIFKKREAGMDKWTAAREGTKEIFFAVISTSITLAVVFIPVIFLQGFTGRLFREFGIVVAGAVLISAFVSLTLTPVLNVKLGGNVTTNGWFYRFSEPFFKGMDRVYGNALRSFMGFRWVSFLILAGCFGLIWHYQKTVKSELAPLEDRSIIRTNLTAPEGTDFDKMESIIFDLSKKVMDSIPEKSMVFGIAAPGFGTASTNSGFVSLLLTDPQERKRSQMQIYNQLLSMTRKMPEARMFPSQEETITVGFGRGLPIQYVIQTLDFEKLKAVVPKFLEEARKDPVFANVDVNLKFNKPELQVIIDRLKAAELGVSVLDVSQTLQLALSGRRFGYFLQNGRQYQVIGQVDRANRDEPIDLAALYVRNAQGEMVQLDNIVRFEETSNPPQLYHHNRYKSATISAAPAPGKTLGEGLEVMDRIAANVLDESFETDLTGPSRDFKESSGNTSFAFLLALLLIYLILAAQFESFRDPLIIMLTVPLAIAGAYLSLSVTGNTFNIFSQIGMIMLIGLVTKNGILIVEFANQKRDAGMPKNQAVWEAAQARLRPILMTTLATALGALPIALSFGAASTSRIGLGVVVVGGLLFSLVLTLFVIPAMYLFLSGKKRNAAPWSKEG